MSKQNEPIKPPVRILTPADGAVEPLPFREEEETKVFPSLLTAKQLLVAAQEGKMNAADIMAHLQARKMLQEALALEAAQEDEAKQAEARLKMIEEQIAEKAAEQAACRHQKQNGEPCIGGQRVHSGHTNYFCQRCGKKWTDNTLPPDLAVDPMRIGGPG